MKYLKIALLSAFAFSTLGVTGFAGFSGPAMACNEFDPCDPGGGPKGNNGVGNGEDPQPPGNPPRNDGPGTGPGNPGNN